MHGAGQPHTWNCQIWQLRYRYCTSRHKSSVAVQWRASQANASSPAESMLPSCPDWMQAVNMMLRHISGRDMTVAQRRQVSASPASVQNSSISKHLCGNVYENHISGSGTRTSAFEAPAVDSMRWPARGFAVPSPAVHQLNYLCQQVFVEGADVARHSS